MLEVAPRRRHADLGGEARRRAGADEHVEVGHLRLEDLGHQPARAGRDVDEVDGDLARSSYGSALVGSSLSEPTVCVAFTRPSIDPVNSVTAIDWMSGTTWEPASRRVSNSTASGRTPEDGTTATGMVTDGTSGCSGVSVILPNRVSPSGEPLTSAVTPIAMLSPGDTVAGVSVTSRVRPASDVEDAVQVTRREPVPSALSGTVRLALP